MPLNYVGGLARDMVFTISVRVCLIMNHGTIVQQNCRGWYVRWSLQFPFVVIWLWTMEPLSRNTIGWLAHDEFCHFCLHLFDYELWNHMYSISYRGRHVWLLSLFLIASILCMDHETNSNCQIVWWGLLRFAPITWECISHAYVYWQYRYRIYKVNWSRSIHIHMYMVAFK